MTAPGMPYRETPSGITAEQAAILAQQTAFAQQQQQLRNQLVAVLLQLWAGVAASNVFSPQAAGKFIANLLPVSIGAQRAMSAITVAQLNQMVAPPTPIYIAPEGVTGEALRGKDPAQVYERPFATVRYQLSRGKTIGQAIDAGRRRAQDIVASDLQLAHTHTARDYLVEAQQRQQEARRTLRERYPRNRLGGPVTEPAPRRNRTLIGYRRQLGTNPNHCALCVLASTQRYRIGTLQPMHPNCSCTVVPLFADEMQHGPHVIDPDLAERVHDIVRRDLGEKYVDPGGRLGDAHYRDILITHEHGELGPVLGVRGQFFQGPNELRLDHRRVNPKPEPPQSPVEPTNLDDL